MTGPARIIGSTAIVATLLAAGCAHDPSAQTVVNAGDSTPLNEREDAMPWDALPDRTHIVAYEFGRCESDADCAPRGCEGSVCSPDGFEGTCVVNEVGTCLAALDANNCACTEEGVCRWARSPEVLACHWEIVEVPESRSYEGAQGYEYPWRPSW